MKGFHHVLMGKEYNFVLTLDLWICGCQVLCWQVVEQQAIKFVIDQRNG